MVMLSCGSPTGSCGLLAISFQRQPARIGAASLSSVGEKVWFQITEKASLT